MKNNILFLCVCVGLGIWSGCGTYHDTQYAPLEARLNPADVSGAESMVLVNSTAQALHNVHFKAYVWGQNQLTGSSQQPYQLTSASEQPQPAPVQADKFEGSVVKLDPGEVIHFRGRGMIGESRILGSVTKVEITGKCDEGAFRETWLMGGNGQLQPAGD